LDLVKNDTFSCSSHEGNRAKVFYQISINIIIIIIIVVVMITIITPWSKVLPKRLIVP
jgi:hypothetical protein